MTQEKQKEVIRHFVKFLKENGVYQMYKANLMKDVNRNNYVGFTYGIQLKVLYDPSGYKRKFSMYLAEELINYASAGLKRHKDMTSGHIYHQNGMNTWI